jgi:hypothetical protein
MIDINNIPRFTIIGKTDTITKNIILSSYYILPTKPDGIFLNQTVTIPLSS